MIKLTSLERTLSIPRKLRYRVTDGVYTWKMFLASFPLDDNQIGRIGDVWIGTSEGAQGIYIKGKDNRWHAWCRRNKYYRKPRHSAKFKNSYHPWLRRRHLEFNGSSAVGWYHRSMDKHHQSSWIQNQVTFNNASSYDHLEVPWIARFVAGSISLDPGQLDTDSQSSASQSGANATNERSSAGSGRGHASESHSLQPSLKRERSESPGVLLPAKRPRVVSIASSPSRVIQSQATQDPLAHPGAEGTVASFLDGLPMSLSRHAHLLLTLGITELSYVDSLSCMPKQYLDKFVVLLQERGFTFMETLVLRNALGDRRRAASPSPHADHEGPRGGPLDIETFLARLRPSMAHHAPIFDEFGIELTHIPVLALLGDESYMEFERALSAKGLSWIDAFILKVGIQEHARHVPRTPLPAAD
ncbi:hypothetical protein C8Q76DRAFT_439890 [Earliella scabrosa]|nr:hypothetical protein C8Q76DRAFT_439890 [Earliella scabrosa]